MLLTISHASGPQICIRRLAGGRASVSSGSGVSPKPKLAKRWLNSDRSTGSSGSPEGFWLPSASSAGGRSDCGSLGIRVRLPKKSSAGLRDEGCSPSRMAPKNSRHGAGGTNSWVHALKLLHGKILDRQWRPRGSTMEELPRCCVTTPESVGLPQSARCQEPWHLSIQTVALFHRRGRCGTLDPAGNFLRGKWLSICIEIARLLLPSGLPPVAASQPFG